MSRYFFDIIRNDAVISRDCSGSDAPDLNCAQMEAVEIWKQIKISWLLKGEDPSGLVLAIHDEAGTVCAKMSMSLVSDRADAILRMV